MNKSNCQFSLLIIVIHQHIVGQERQIYKQEKDTGFSERKCSDFLLIPVNHSAYYYLINSVPRACCLLWWRKSVPGLWESASAKHTLQACFRDTANREYTR